MHSALMMRYLAHVIAKNISRMCDLIRLNVDMVAHGALFVSEYCERIHCAQIHTVIILAQVRLCWRRMLIILSR